MIKNIFFFTILTFSFITNVFATEFKCFKKTGFITEKYKFKRDINFKDPENTLIFIFHHGGKGDRAAKASDCAFSKYYLKNVIELTKEDFGTKKNLVYVVNTKPLWGDAYKDKKSKTKWLPFPGGKYPGKTKTEKKVDLTNKIIDDFIQKGIKPHNIIISGHSCGGWLTLLYTARYPEKVRGGIAYHPACFGELTAYKIWTEKGLDDYLWDFNDHERGTCETKDRYKWEYACSRAYLKLRTKNMSEITSAKDLRVAVIHNDDDPFEGKTSKWLKRIESVEFIETPTKNENYIINGKSCKAKELSKKWYGTDLGHNVYQSKCMTEFFPRIVKYLKDQ